MSKPYLKKAERLDADILFEFANDRETRKNAFNTEPIPYETHIKWFEGKLNSENCIIYILRCDGESVGQLRLEKEDKNVIISYSIDNKQRGKGYGSLLISLAFEQALKENIFSHCDTLVGYVKYENIASQKCFVKNGFTRSDKEDFIAYSKVLKNG